VQEANEVSVASTESGTVGVLQSEAPKRSVSSVAKSIVTPLRNRNFCLLFSGQGISTLGDGVYTVALPWIVLSSGGNAQELGLILSAYGVPRLLTLLLGGMLSDRFSPRVIMLIADIARTVLLGLLAFIVAGGHLSLPLLFAFVIGLGLFTGLFVPATYSILPDILPKAELQAGNALNSSMLQIATLLGSALAGVVIARLQAGSALALDALTFAVSAVTLAAMRSAQRAVSAQPSAESKPADAAQAETASSAAQTLEPDEKSLTFTRFFRESRLLQITLLIVALTFLVSGGTMGVALPAYALGPLAAGANGIGLVLAIFGAGELIGGLAAGGLGHLPHRPMIVLILQLGQAITFVLLPIFANVAWAFTILALAGLLNGLMNVIYFTLIQEMFPNRFMGRIWGIVMFATYGLYPLSVLLGGLITTRFGANLVFIAGGCILALAAIMGLLSRELREIN